MFDEYVWSALVAKCQSIYQRHGLGIPIPSDIVSDPVEVFDQIDVAKNVFRFVVYILWLKNQPEAFEKLCIPKCLGIGGFMLTSLFTFLLICIRLCVQKETC